MAIRTTRPRPRRPAKGYPFSRSRLAQTPLYGAAGDILIPLLNRDTCYFFDDFLTKTISSADYTLTTGGGTMSTTGVAFAASVTQNGNIIGTTGTTSADSQSISRPIFYSGQQNPYFEVTLAITATTSNTSIEVGFWDAIPASGTSSLTDVDVPTWVAADAAIFSLDTSQTIATLVCATIGSYTGQTSQITTLSTVTAPLISLTQTSAVTFGIELVHLPTATGAASNVAQALFYVNDVRVASHGDDADGAVNAAVLLAPYVYVRTRTGAAKTSKLDYWMELADRA